MFTALQHFCLDRRSTLAWLVSIGEEINSLALHPAKIGDKGGLLSFLTGALENCSCSATKPGNWIPLWLAFSFCRKIKQDL